MSAAHARQAFVGGRAGRLRRGGAVHAVTLRPWWGVDVPGPACHVGTAGWDFTRLEPTSDGVTCRRCLRSAVGRAVSPVQVVGGQLALDLDRLG